MALSSTPTPDISMHVNIVIASENVTKWFEACVPVYKAIIAEQNNTFFEIYQDLKNPGEISTRLRLFDNDITPQTLRATLGRVPYWR
ncbi:uncharacterized protein BDV17DRAFT_294557 [Aspergillus undulatus]|uniref:uncharacterized protein n=1 Tax=Aspergillus undulatus TaxID=1810928 RepID=UPI003CCCD103